MPDQEPRPKVTPYLVERAGELCPRRLRLDFQGQKGDQGAFTRGRVRDPLVEDARAAQAEMGPPNPASFRVRTELLPEEQAVQRRSIDHYLEMFGAESARAIDHDPYRQRTPRRGIEVGGWIDLACEREDGAPEYRQLEIWGRDVAPDPTLNMNLLLALLRLSKWIAGRTVHVRVADLIRGVRRDAEVDLGARQDELVALFEERLTLIEARARRAQAVPGDHCTACPYVAGCPAFLER